MSVRKWAAMRSTVPGLEEIGCCTATLSPARPLGGFGDTTASGRTWRSRRQDGHALASVRCELAGCFHRYVLKRKHHLEHRRVVRMSRPGADSSTSLSKAGPGRVRAQRRRSHAPEQLQETTDRPRGPPAGPACSRSSRSGSRSRPRFDWRSAFPPSKSVLSRIAEEQRLERREYHHEECRALAFAERLEALRQIVRARHLMPRATVRLNTGPTWSAARPSRAAHPGACLSSMRLRFPISVSSRVTFPHAAKSAY